MGLAVIYLLSPMNEVTAPSTVRAGSTPLHFLRNGMICTSTNGKAQHASLVKHETRGW